MLGPPDHNILLARWSEGRIETAACDFSFAALRHPTARVNNDGPLHRSVWRTHCDATASRITSALTHAKEAP